MRAFVAVGISKNVVSSLERLVERERESFPGARWVQLANLHLTLRFLGETSEQVLCGMVRDLRASVARFPLFTWDCRGVGFFPSARRPRVFWVGVSNPPVSLVRIHEEIEGIARRHGFEAENRKFSPHLTLARFREPRFDSRFAEIEKELRDHHFGASRIREVVMYRSILRPQGAEHQVLHKFLLSEVQ